MQFMTDVKEPMMEPMMALAMALANPMLNSSRNDAETQPGFCGIFHLKVQLASCQPGGRRCKDETEMMPFILLIIYYKWEYIYIWDKWYLSWKIVDHLIWILKYWSWPDHDWYYKFIHKAYEWKVLGMIDHSFFLANWDVNWYIILCSLFTINHSHHSWHDPDMITIHHHDL